MPPFGLRSTPWCLILRSAVCCVVSCLGRAGCWLIAGLVVNSIGGWNLPFRLLARAALTVFDHLA